MGELHLLGINYWDLMGPKRLQYFLNKIKPSIIALENSQKNVEIHRKRHEYFTKVYQKDADQDKSYLEKELLSILGFEVWKTDEYLENNPKARLHIFPDNELQEEFSKKIWEDMIDNNNIADPLSKGIKNKLESISRRYFQNKMESSYRSPKRQKLQTGWVQRETMKPVESYIRNIYEENPEDKILYIGPSKRFIGNFGSFHRNLYEFLNDLNPTTHLLGKTPHLKDPIRVLKQKINNLTSFMRYPEEPIPFTTGKGGIIVETSMPIY